MWKIHTSSLRGKCKERVRTLLRLPKQAFIMLPQYEHQSCWGIENFALKNGNFLLKC